jgi:hypothetical protein
MDSPKKKTNIKKSKCKTLNKVIYNCEKKASTKALGFLEKPLKQSDIFQDCKCKSKNK